MAGPQVQTRVITQTFTIAANTLASAPFTQSLNLGQTQIESLRVRIPRGHVGLTGFAFRYGQARIIPWDDSADWVVGDDEIMDLPIYLDVSVPITLIGFNAGVMAHGFELRFTVNDAAYLNVDSAPNLIIPA